MHPPYADPSTLRAISLGGMLLTELRYPSGAWVPPREESCQVLVIILSGSLGERIGGRDHQVVTGSLYVKGKGVRHSSLVGPEGAHCLSIALVDRPGGDFMLPRPNGAPQQVRGASCARIGRRIARMEWHEQPANRLRLEAHLLELLSCVAANLSMQSEPPAWLQLVHDQLRREFRSPPTIAQLAAAADVHPSHLLRSFRRHFGLSPTELIRRAKAEHALGMLGQPGTTLSEAASVSGFADQSHMGRVMRQIYGRTPARLQREQIRLLKNGIAQGETVPQAPSPFD